MFCLSKFTRILLQYNPRTFFSNLSFTMDSDLRSTPHKDRLKVLKDEFRLYDTEQQTSVDLTIERYIATVTLNNPKRLNSLTGKMMVDLSEVIDKIEEEIKNEESTLIGLIIEGEGKNLCSGLDLDLAQENFQSPESGGKLCFLMQDNYERIKRLSLVSVCAIEGYALGGGAELSTSTDFRIASSTSVVRFVHRNIGIVPGWGGATRLTEILGYNEALYYLATTKPLLIPEVGKKNSFFDIVCENGKANETARTFLNDFIPEFSQGHMTRNIKSLMVAQRLAKSTQEKLELEMNKFIRLWGSTSNLNAVSVAKSKKGKKL